MNYARHLHIGFLRTKVYWNFGWPVSLCTTQCVARLLRVFLEHSIEFNLIFSVFSSHWHLKKFADCSIPANFVSIKVSNQIHSTFRMYGVFVLGTNTSKKGLMDLFCAVGYQTFDANINFNLINCHNQTDAMLKARRKWSSKRKRESNWAMRAYPSWSNTMVAIVGRKKIPNSKNETNKHTPFPPVRPPYHLMWFYRGILLLRNYFVTFISSWHFYLNKMQYNSMTLPFRLPAIDYYVSATGFQNGI